MAEVAEDSPSNPEIAQKRDTLVVYTSTKHDLRSYNNAVTFAMCDNKRERVPPSLTELDRTKRSGIWNTLIVNKLLGHRGSFSLAGGINISPDLF